MKRNAKVTLVNDIRDALGTPGAIEIRPVYKGTAIGGIAFVCPCGCGRDGWLPLKPERANGWEWNGDHAKPTLSPSILQSGGCRWHGYLTDGEFREC